VKKILKKNQLMITALAFMIAVAGYLHFSGDVADQITISDSENKEVMEAANMMEYTVEDTYTSDEFAQLEQDTMFEISDEDMLTSGEESTDSDTLVDIESLDLDIDDTELLSSGYIDDENNTDMVSASAQTEQELYADSSDITEGEIPGEAVFTSTVSVNTLQGAKLLKEQTRYENKEALLEIINNTAIADDQKQIALDSMVALKKMAEKEMSAEILLSARGFTDAVVSITGNTVDVVVSGNQISDAQRAQIEDIVMRKTNTSIENIVISTTAE